MTAVRHRPETEALLTPSEVATLFRVDPKTVTRWAKAGKLTSIRTLGGHRRYRRLRLVHCSRVFRSSAPSDLLPSSPSGRPSGTAQGECGSTRSMEWGVGPGGGVPHRRCCPAGKSPARHIPEGTLPGPVRSQGRVARISEFGTTGRARTFRPRSPASGSGPRPGRLDLG